MARTAKLPKKTNQSAVVKMPQLPILLGIAELQVLYGFGRDCAGDIVNAMPHFQVGTHRKVLRYDLDQLITWASRRRLDIWAWARGELDVGSPFDVEGNDE